MNKDDNQLNKVVQAITQRVESYFNIHNINGHIEMTPLGLAAFIDVSPEDKKIHSERLDLIIKEVVEEFKVDHKCDCPNCFESSNINEIIRYATKYAMEHNPPEINSDGKFDDSKQIEAISDTIIEALHHRNLL